jgi:hypothetical protein
MTSPELDVHSFDQLFVRILNLASKSDDGGLVVARENFMTECVAATLSADRQLMITFLRRLAPGIAIPEGYQPWMETQYSFSNPRCCIDMLFTVAPGVRIGVENKLNSPEGERQLWKYLKASDFNVAFITAKNAPIDPEVLEHERYLRPSPRAHFRWTDFWDILETSVKSSTATVFNSNLLALFEHYGFTPLPRNIPNIWATDDKERLTNEAEFAKLWQATKIGLEERGWIDYSPGARIELYVSGKTSPLIKRIWLNPGAKQGAFRIRFVFHGDIRPTKYFDAVTSLAIPPRTDVNIEHGDSRNEAGEVVDVVIPIRKLIPDSLSGEEASAAIATYVLAVIDAVEQITVGSGER